MNASFNVSNLNNFSAIEKKSERNPKKFDNNELQVQLDGEDTQSKKIVSQLNITRQVIFDLLKAIKKF